MPRVKSGVTAHRRHKKILKLAKGYRGAPRKLDVDPTYHVLKDV